MSADMINEKSPNSPIDNIGVSKIELNILTFSATSQAKADTIMLTKPYPKVWLTARHL